MAGEKGKTKKSGLGCLVKLIILILILILIAYVAVKFFFPAERVRQEIVTRASAAIGRNVDLDEVSLSIFPSLALKLKGLRIQNPPGVSGREFLYVDELSAGLKLFPLLSGEYQFNRIELFHPVIHLHKMPDGLTNYDFSVAGSEVGVTSPVGDKEKIGTKEAAFTVFAFDWAEIKSGDIVYLDDSSKIQFDLSDVSLKSKLNLQGDGRHAKSSGTIEIAGLSSNLWPENLPVAVELSYNADVDYQFSDVILDNSSLQINGIPFGLKATVRNFKSPKSIFLQMEANGVAIAPFLKYLPSGETFDMDKLRLSGKIAGTAETRIEPGQNRKPYYAASFMIGDMILGYANTSNRIHFDSLSMGFDGDTLQFKSFKGDMSGQPFEINGKLTDFEDLHYNINTAGEYSLVGLTPFLDETTHPEISGRMTFEITADGDIAHWPQTGYLGHVAVDNLYYNDDSLTSPLNRLDLNLQFEKKQARVENLYVEYPGVKATLTGTIKNGFAHLLEPDGGHAKPYLDFDLHAPIINYDTLIPMEEAHPSETGSAGGELSENGTVRTPIFLPDIEAGGRVQIDKFVFSDVEVTNISGKVKYANGIIDYSDLKGSVYSGELTSKGTVNITNMFEPEVTADFSANKIQANDFMEQFTKVGGHLYGQLDLKGKLDGKGSEIEDFVNSLNATGKVEMGEGQVVNFDLIKKMAEQFNFKTFEVEKINDIVSDVIIRNGNLILDGTKVKSDLGDWDLSGKINFLQKDLDLGVSLYLAEKNSKDIKLLGGLLQDDKGRVRINFDLTGPYDSPAISNISTDNSVIKKKVEEEIKDKAKGLLDNLLKKK